MTKTTTARSSAVQPAAEQGEPYVVQHMVVSGDREIKVCVCYPAGYWPLSAGSATLPWLVYLHAGGFVEGDVEAAKELARDLAESVPAVVVTPGYSLAPENPFPAAPEDAVATVTWVLKQAKKLKVDKLRFALVGEEAGGNLAIATAQMLRDRGLPQPAGQWLIRPVTDPCLSAMSSTRQVPMEMLRRLACNYREYLPTPADSVHPYAAPALASRMAGLPATLVQVAEQDALRAEGEAFAAKLAKAGISARALIMPGACGDGVEQSHEKCQAWVEEGARFLRDCFAKADDAS
ncbi:alpha/beta hydrolase [Cupriavidus metallidurans]|jgi:acetyl esterase/lipase|uniref:Esterase/lipase/thioesterase n=1 Tax=Cupriavidus metallidurans (strain ATCC 43123 / DSM 2839 / NBRC 102507 / CH34) TaxID=266264 RepID=Q1LDP6_CUPMC|nr:alpha/beta hydrolase [Cupriavidus metallidurans]ABF11730.1 esterase/lipase/thioesterase [Cupriavidus metallidurans CH34]KWW35168.1 Carboxylesterase NlhH [Cupriavidus metallidurans]MDE4922349.1 alpha/beta hydrolase [Cupriavidus metallidurans]QGS33385.1 alpha/beta hydrolase fold domain-containing protein [Cupriavidus metallidurans]UBM09498.1 alpha/beta hydrolase [Cupriavidus metallidurans]